MQSDLGPSLKTCAIGLDVGGTKIAGGVVQLSSGQVLARQVVPTQPWRGGEAVLNDAWKLAERLLVKAQELNVDILGIGVGVAELIDLQGNVTSDHTIAWRGVPLQAAFSRLAPTVVESDVRAAALAESKYGAGQPFNLFVYITVGTGISCCLVQHGQPYAGARGNALILASSPLLFTCSVCGAVSKPLLEEIASGPALVRRYNQALLPSGSAERGEDILNAAQAGDPVAVDVVRTAGEMLGSAVGWLVNVLDPEAVIVGGGLGLAGGLYWGSFAASTRHHVYAADTRQLPIIPAALGTDAGLIGAAASVDR